jgi:putative endonuclease
MVRIHAGQPFDSGLAMLGLRSWQAIRREAGVECPEQGPQARVEGLSTAVCHQLRMSSIIEAISTPTSGVFVYILACRDGVLYVGSAKDVGRRIKLHRAGRGAKFTHDHPDANLVYVEGPFDRETAICRERQLKRWSRAKKLALIGGELVTLHSLARRRGPLAVVKPSSSAGLGPRRRR